MLRPLAVILLAGLFCQPAAAAADQAPRLVGEERISTSAPLELRDLYYGEALFHAFQGEWFEAIARLDTELEQNHGLDQPELDSLYPYLGQAEFAVGDFELAYRMHQRAGRALQAVIEARVAEPVKNEALYRLGRIYFQKGQPRNALYALDRIEGEVPAGIRHEIEFLRAQVFLTTGRNAEAAALLEALLDEPELQGFASYNLGIALMRDGRAGAGRQVLDQTGRIAGEAPAVEAIRDKANLVLGYQLLEEEQPEKAQQALERVRLEGVFSNRALLGWGWADAAQGRYARALVPWSLLVDRQVTDAAVQEAMLALPYAYGQLERFGKAAVLYGNALQTFENQVDRLTESIISIREGRFLEALVREELKQDADWLVKLRDLPETPETYYLLELMASHDFQESLKNYLDLEGLRARLATWQRDLDAFAELIERRRAYYEPLLPQIDQAFRELDSQMRLRLEQREHIRKRLKAMLAAPRPDYLASAEEQEIRQSLARLEQSLKTAAAIEAGKAATRIQRLRGVLVWTIETDYDRRLTEAYHNLHALNRDIDRLEQQYRSFVRTRQAATQSYQGYDEELRRQRQHIRTAREKVGALLARQGHLLEVMAIDELSRRRDRLEEFVVKTRFALADSYDRAARAQGLERVKP